MMPEIRVSFMVIGETIAPEAITEAVGREPTRLVRIGEEEELIPGKRATRNRWELQAPDQTGEPEDQIESLLRLLSPRASTIANLAANGCEVYLSCIVYDGWGRIIFTLEEDHLRQISRLNAGLYVAYYYFSDAALDADAADDRPPNGSP
jgi:hypothetical protein